MRNGALIAVALTVLYSPRVWMICPQKAGCGSVCGQRFAPYASGIGPCRRPGSCVWCVLIAVKEPNLSYYFGEMLLFTIYIYICISIMVT